MVTSKSLLCFGECTLKQCYGIKYKDLTLLKLGVIKTTYVSGDPSRITLNTNYGLITVNTSVGVRNIIQTDRVLYQVISRNKPPFFMSTPVRKVKDIESKARQTFILLRN